MAEISYTLFENAYLKRSPLYLEQIEAIIDVSNADPDPLTLQQIRDEQSIRQCFMDRRKNVQEMAVDYSNRIKQAATEEDAKKLLAEFNGKLRTESTRLERELQQRVDAFAQKQKREVNDLFWARARLACRVIYAAAKLMKSGSEAFAKVTAAVAGPGIFLGVVAVKSLIASAIDLQGAFGELMSAIEDERAQFAKLEAGVKKLKSYKAPKPVPQGDIDAVETMLGPYGARLLGADAKAKAVATQLDKYLTDLEKGKFRDEGTQEAAEKVVKKSIKQVIELSQNIDQGRKMVQAARQKVTDCAKRAKANPSSFWDYAPSLWKLFDGVFDMHAESMDVSGWKDTAGKYWEVLQGKLQDELKDAMVDEHTK